MNVTIDVDHRLNRIVPQSCVQEYGLLVRLERLQAVSAFFCFTIYATSYDMILLIDEHAIFSKMLK